MSRFVHHELNTSDPKAAKKFYKGLFGWKYQDMPMPNGIYTMVESKDGPIGGIQQHPMKGAPSHWLGYITVASIDTTTKKVEKLGGKTIVPKVTIPNFGEFAVYADPTGATFACWKELAKPKPAAKKRSTKKRAAKKAAKKKSTKKAAKKRAAKKRAAKKKSTKKAAKKKSTKKAAKKKSTKKAAKKKSTKKAAKKAAKKRTAKKAAKKRKR